MSRALPETNLSHARGETRVSGAHSGRDREIVRIRYCSGRDEEPKESVDVPELPFEQGNAHVEQRREVVPVAGYRVVQIAKTLLQVFTGPTEPVFSTRSALTMAGGRRGPDFIQQPKQLTEAVARDRARGLEVREGMKRLFYRPVEKKGQPDKFLGGPKVWEFKDFAPENIREIDCRMGPETLAEKLQQATTYILTLEAKLHASQRDRGAIEPAAADERFWSVTDD